MKVDEETPRLEESRRVPLCWRVPAMAARSRLPVRLALCHGRLSTAAAVWLLFALAVSVGSLEICPEVSRVVRFSAALPLSEDDFAGDKHSEFRAAVFEHVPVYGTLQSDVSLHVDSMERYLNLSVAAGARYKTLEWHLNKTGRYTEERSCYDDSACRQVIASTIRVDAFILAESKVSAETIAAAFQSTNLTDDLLPALNSRGVTDELIVLEPAVTIIKERSARVPGQRNFRCHCPDRVYARAAAVENFKPDCSCIAPRDTDRRPTIHDHAVDGADDGECVCNLGESGPAGGPCSPCVAGTYKQVVGTFDCTKCGLHTYSSSKGAKSPATCLTCPSGSVTLATGQKLITDCKCNEGFTGPDGGPCPMCVAGKFKPSIGTDACTNCSIDTYSTIVGASSQDVCENCPSQTQSPLGSDQLTDCICILGHAPPGSNKFKVGALVTARVLRIVVQEPGVDVQGNISGGLYNDLYNGTITADNGDDTFSVMYDSAIDGRGSDAAVAANDIYCRESSESCTENAGNGKACVGCVPGKYKATTGSARCTNCPAHTFLTTAAAEDVSKCESCPDFTQAPAGSDERADCICNQGYTGDDGSSPAACAACVAGTYKDFAGSYPCTNCPADSYSPETAETSLDTCTACPASTQSVAGSSVITDCVCVVGYTGPDGGECTECEKGKFKDAIGDAACDDCAIGQHQTLTGQTECMDCVAGKYAPEPGHVDCLNCPTGRFQPSEGQGACLQCAPGKYNNQIGSITVSDCLNCPTGQYQDVSAQASCKLCGAGKFNAYIGMSSPSDCIPCAVGKYQGEAGQNACMNCDPGKYSPLEGQETDGCIPCPAGAYQPFGGKGSCFLCEAGTFNPAQGKVSPDVCTPCAAGSYNTQQGQGSCAQCEGGKFQPEEGNKVGCDDCEPGKFAGGGAAECSCCAKGKFQPDSGKANCENCPAGKYGPWECALYASSGQTGT